MDAMSRPLAIAFIAILLGGAAGGVVGAIVSNDDDASAAAAAPAPQSASSSAPTPAAMYRRDAPGVVQITAGQSLGSGFVIDTRGDIVTNDHVIAGATGVHIGFTGGSSYPATVVGTDPSSDLAVVRVSAPASKLHPVAFDDSSNVQIGETVYAIGNPFGLDRTMTAGIVSATGRDIQAPDGLTIPNAIQTDAAINHGNSGGPLLDSQGHVIGITSQIQGGTVDANVGVGFTVPRDTARSVAQQLIAHGKAEHPWLGARLEPPVTVCSWPRWSRAARRRRPAWRATSSPRSTASRSTPRPIWRMPSRAASRATWCAWRSSAGERTRSFP
jgi:S1-C subfamily serine protease